MVYSLEHYVRHEKAQPLSVGRLKKYARRPGLKFMDYEDIGKKTLKQIVGPAGGCCIMWSDPEGKIGHFVGLFKRPEGYLYFDPTGLAIHRLAEVTHNPETLRKKLEAAKVTYNRLRFQKIRSDTQSCGRHVLCRWNMLQLSDKEYRGVMTHKKLSPDEIAVMLTLPSDLAHWKRTLKEEARG